jgi:hypothetical protein
MNGSVRFRAGVRHAHPQRLLADLDSDLHARVGSGVLEAIGQRFLHDAVDRQLQAAGERRRLAAGAAGHSRPGRAGALLPAAHRIRLDLADAAVGEADDHGEVVADDVVHLAGSSRWFGARSSRRCT